MTPFETGQLQFYVLIPPAPNVSKSQSGAKPWRIFSYPMELVLQKGTGVSSLNKQWVVTKIFTLTQARLMDSGSQKFLQNINVLVSSQEAHLS